MKPSTRVCRRNCQRWTRRLLAALVLPCLPLPSLALDYQVHGYAGQGYVLSSGNNVFGESTKGSVNYYEAGLNGSLRPVTQLIIAAQGAIRDAGATDTGVPRLDYWLADYRAWSSEDAGVGLRIGKVKNPIGFFNETRDVVFTRPGILLPGVYDDNQGTRNLLYTSTGAQSYASAVWGAHEVSLVGTWSRNHDLPGSQKQLLVQLNGLPFDLRVTHSWNAQLMDSIDGGRWQLGFSHFYGRFSVTTSPTVSLYASVDTVIDVFSFRYNGEKFSVTSEYALYPAHQFIQLPNPAPPPALVAQRARSVADTGYVQADYRITGNWTLMGRADMTFGNQADRNGHKFAASNPGADPAAIFGYDLATGLRWQPQEHWGVWTEYHRIYGTVNTQPLDNQGRVLNDHWSLFMLMAACKF